MPLFRASLALFEDVGDREGLAGVLSSIGSALAEDGAFEEGIASLRRAAMLYEEMGHGGFLPEAERELAFALIQSGDLADAELHALRGAEIVAPEDWGTVASTRMVLWRVRAAPKRDEEAEALLRGAIEVIEKTDYQAGQSEEYLALAEFLLERGRHEEGEAMGAKARDLALMFGEESRSVRFIDGHLAAARDAGRTR
jgi:tetratricopeptide (TPR) repeat protein